MAEEAHFTRAAERIQVAQPAVSQQIRQLEHELGQRLFVRTRQGARLTEAGAAFLPHARAALSAVDAARASVAALSGLLQGRLAIGALQPLPDRRLPQLIGAFHRRHPGVELRLVEAETEDLLSALRSGALDLAVIGTGPYHEPPDDVTSLLLAREPVVVAVRAGHALARRSSIPLAALRGEPLVTLTARSRLRPTLEAAARQAGFAPHVVAETTDLRMLVDLVVEGIGSAVLPGSAMPAVPTVKLIKITRPKIERRLLLVWRRSDVSPAAAAFVALARAGVDSS